MADSEVVYEKCNFMLPKLPTTGRTWLIKVVKLGRRLQTQMLNQDTM